MRWILLGGLLFVLLAVVMAPAQIVAMLLNRGAVQLVSPTGSLWAGRGHLSLAGAPIGELHWRVRPLALLHAAIALDIELVGPEARLRGGSELTGSSMAVAEVGGVVGEALLARIASHYDVDLQQPLRITNVAIRIVGRGSSGTVTSATGQLDWPGGHVEYLLNGQRHAADLGPLHGVLRADANRVVLHVTEASTRKAALRFAISPNGWGSAAVTKQFMASTGFPWQGSAKSDAFVLEVEEKLF